LKYFSTGFTELTISKIVVKIRQNGFAKYHQQQKIVSLHIPQALL
jgi:hypothetical protein